MSVKRLEHALGGKLNELREKGILKGGEMVITGVKPADDEKGPRCFIEGRGEKEFLRMNSNSYLGMSSSCVGITCYYCYAYTKNF